MRANSGLPQLAELHSRLFVHCLDGVGPGTLWERPGGRGNPLGFVALHLIDARVFLGRLAGADTAHPFTAAVEEVRSFEELGIRPDVDELLSAWTAIAHETERALREADGSILAGPPPHDFPVADRTVLGGLWFLLHHEAYHLGQMALLRRQLGLPAMVYGEPDED